MSKILMPSTEKQLKFGSAYVSEALGLGCLGWLDFPKNCWLFLILWSFQLHGVGGLASSVKCIKKSQGQIGKPKLVDPFYKK